MGKHIKHGLRGEELKEYTRRYNLERSRTRKGLMERLYYAQTRNSKARGHKLQEYTKEEFVEWCIADSIFEELYLKWVDSGYDKYLRPSVDRKDDYLPYTFSNIQLMTWRDNDRKGALDRRNGKNNKISKKVFKLDASGNDIAEFNSISEAARKCGVSVGTISNHANNKTTTKKGIKLWRF